ncbi:MAG: hypothetical protein ORN98_08945 [Alphaproteobacteria bacterium]|nr:hypothetical protein [Alphaproteobacteria bacterium]
MLQNLWTGFAALGNGFVRIGQSFSSTEQERNDRVVEAWRESWNRIVGDLANVMGKNGINTTRSYKATMTLEELNDYIQEAHRQGSNITITRLD